MIFTCDLKTMTKSVFNVMLATATSSPTPILDGIFLECKEGSLYLKAFNNELSISTSIEINKMGSKEGKTVINGKMLGEILRKLSGETVSFEMKANNKINIRSGNSLLSVMGFDGDDYPEIPQRVEGNEFEINAEILREMIAKTMFATSDKEYTPIYTGCLFKTNGDRFEIVAVDGHRLALKREDNNSDVVLDFVIPKRSLIEIMKLLSEYSDENISIVSDDKTAFIKINEYEIATKLLKGDFLNYEQTIQKEFLHFFNIDPGLLIESIETAMVIINDRIKTPVTAIISNGNISIKSETTVGKADTNISIDYTGDNYTIGFNSKYMLDALKACSGDEIVICFNDEVSPIMIKPAEGDEFVYIILPVKLSVITKEAMEDN